MPQQTTTGRPSDRTPRPDTPSRRSVAIEDVLRSDTRLADLWQVIVALWRILPDRHRLLGAVLLLTLLEVGLQLSLALTGKTVLDDVMNGARLDFRLLGAAVLLLLGTLALSRWRQIAIETAALNWRSAAVDRLSRNIADGSLEDLSSVPMAGLREIIMTDAPFLTRFAVETLSQGFVLVLWIAAAFSFLLVFGTPLLWVLALLLLLCGSLLALGLTRHLGLTAERFRRLADLSQSARDVVEVERVLLTRQFGLGSRFIDRFRQAHDAFRDVALRQGRVSAGIRASLATLNAIAFVALVTAGSLLIATGSLEPGVLLAALFVIGQMLNALLVMGDIAGRSAESAAAGRRLSIYWDEQSSGPCAAAGNTGHGATASPGEPRPGSAASNAAHRDVPIVNTLHAGCVAYAYHPGKAVFSSVELSLKRGQITALTAETGAGKSTFARVLCGLLPPMHGEVTAHLDDATLPVMALPAGSILYLGAQPIMLPGSIHDNLLLADTPNELPSEIAVVRKALARNGTALDWQAPLIDAGGMGLSSGQAQLVQLARALVREPAIVVFDEATSSLDMPTEADVQSQLVDWCRRRICLVISHRDCPWLEASTRQLSW